jgi:hypothetical protein
MKKSEIGKKQIPLYCPRRLFGAVEGPRRTRLASLSKVNVDSASANLSLVHGLKSLGGVSLRLELYKAESPGTHKQRTRCQDEVYLKRAC